MTGPMCMVSSLERQQPCPALSWTPCFSPGHFQRAIWASDDHLGCCLPLPTVAQSLDIESIGGAAVPWQAELSGAHICPVFSPNLFCFQILPIFQHLLPLTSDISQTAQQASFSLFLGALSWHICMCGLAYPCWGSTICLLLTVI